VEKFSYCIIPTTLNPLGIAKHADVITRTFKHIRQLSADAEMFAIINSYDVSKDAEKRNGVLLQHLQRHIDLYAATDPKCQLIHPDAAKIRYSVSLLYWGYHILKVQNRNWRSVKRPGAVIRAQTFYNWRIIILLLEQGKFK